MREDRATYNIQVDTHVHTVVSGHAWSTLRENVAQAKRVGLQGFCLTEHSEAIPGAAPAWIPATMEMLPTEEDGVRIYHGLEADILGADGVLTPAEEYLARLEFCIASMHFVAANTHFQRSVEACTEAYVRALENPYVTVLGHVDRIAFPCDIETVVRKAGDCGKLMELNNASLIPARAAGHENVAQILRFCKQYDVSICVGSDAHYCGMVGDFRLAEALLKELAFPPELIANQTRERFARILQERHKAIADYKRRGAYAEADRKFVY